MYKNNNHQNLNSTKDLNGGYIVYISSIFNLIIALTGIVGNIVNIFVFKQKRMKINVTNHYFLLTAIFELIFSSLIFTEYLCRFIHPAKIFLHELHEILEFIVNILISAIDSNLTILTLGLSIYKVKIIKNVNGKQTFLLEKFEISRFIIIFSILVTVVEITSYSLCYYFKYVTSFYLSYCLFIKPIVFTIVPIIVILVINLLLVKELLKYFQTKTRERNSLIEQLMLEKNKGSNTQEPKKKERREDHCDTLEE